MPLLWARPLYGCLRRVRAHRCSRWRTPTSSASGPRPQRRSARRCPSYCTRSWPRSRCVVAGRGHGVTRAGPTDRQPARVHRAAGAPPRRLRARRRPVLAVPLARRTLPFCMHIPARAAVRHPVRQMRAGAIILLRNFCSLATRPPLPPLTTRRPAWRTSIAAPRYPTHRCVKPGPRALLALFINLHPPTRPSVMTDGISLSRAHRFVSSNCDKFCYPAAGGR